MNAPLSDWTHGYRTDLEYTFGVYTFLNPDLLLLRAVMSGVKPSASILSGGAEDTRGLVYCDLGCGQGMTTNLMAARDPGGKYFGIDYNSAMIANAKALAEDAKITNVTFLAESFTNLLNLDMPDCDVVVMHGIWSWVDDGLRQNIIDFLKKKLKPGGICFVSYNSAVGRNDGPMRELLRLAERASHATGEARVNEAITLANQVAKGGAKYFRQHSAAADRLSSLSGKGARYVTHEYLNTSWYPFYFRDVAAHFAQAGLGYAGSSEHVWNRNDLSLPDEAYPLLQRVSSVEDQELIKDIWAGNAFRKDIFIKGRTILSTAEQEQLLAPLHFAAIRAPEFLKPQIEIPVGVANLDEKLYSNIFQRLQHTPVSGTELIEHAKTHGTTLLNVLEPLLIANYVALCGPRGAGARISAPLARLDAAMERLNIKGLDVNLASLPGLATATALMPLDYLIWQASRAKVQDRAEHVFNTMKRTGRQVMQSNAVVADENRARALLRETVALYDKHVAPVLLAGIVHLK
jgi:SAM-dependent methyltransferase